MLSIQNQQKRLPHLSRSLRRRAKKVLEELALDEVMVSVTLCDDPSIQALNSEWRGKDTPTDVLSFPQDDFEPAEVFRDGKFDVDKAFQFPGMPKMLGDIIISVDTTIRQAEEYQHTPLDEATRLYIHGLLHLCGFDHIEPEDAAEMLQEEERLLKLFPSRKITPLVSF